MNLSSYVTGEIMRLWNNLTFMKGIRENVSGAFIFARKLCDIVCLESNRSTLESTCRHGEQRKVFLNFSLAESFFFNTKKTFCTHSSSLELITPELFDVKLLQVASHELRCWYLKLCNRTLWTDRPREDGTFFLVNYSYQCWPDGLLGTYTLFIIYFIRISRLKFAKF